MTTTNILEPTEGEPLAVLTDTVTVKVDGSANPFELFEVSGPRASGPPPHRHPWAETFYVLDGELDVLVADEQRRVGAGSVVHVPAGTLHAFAVVSDEARFLTITDGQGAGRFFRELSGLGAVALDDEHLPAIVEIAVRNGLTSPLFP